MIRGHSLRAKEIPESQHPRTGALNSTRLSGRGDTAPKSISHNNSEIALEAGAKIAY